MTELELLESQLIALIDATENYLSVMDSKELNFKKREESLFALKQEIEKTRKAIGR